MGARKIEKAERLARIAGILKPARVPWYVWAPPVGAERTFPAPGWYWIGPGAQYPEYLGASAALAEHELRNRIERELAVTE